jgi:hypothetical protein
MSPIDIPALRALLEKANPDDARSMEALIDARKEAFPALLDEIERLRSPDPMRGLSDDERADAEKLAARINQTMLAGWPPKVEQAARALLAKAAQGKEGKP